MRFYNPRLLGPGEKRLETEFVLLLWPRRGTDHYWYWLEYVWEVREYWRGSEDVWCTLRYRSRTQPQ